VKRKGDTLFFNLKNGKKATFVNTKGETLSNYFYLGRVKELNQYLVKGAFDEWSTNYLVNDLTGDTTEICGAPEISPDNKFVMAVNADLVAGFNFNGFDLLKIEKGSLKKIGRRELSAWGPSSVKWISDKEAFVEIRIPEKDTLNGTLDRAAFIKLRMD
jgi:hypothetical protein